MRESILPLKRVLHINYSVDTRPACIGVSPRASQGMPSLSDIVYPVLVTKRCGGFELRIRELLIIVFATNLEDGWRLLVDYKRQVVGLAEAAGLRDEVPPPDPLPLLAARRVQMPWPYLLKVRA